MSYLARELKPVFEKGIEPLVKLLFEVGVSPNTVTFLGLFFVAFGSYLLYLGERWLSFALLLLGALADAVDGALARRLGKNSTFGAFLDSLLDRVSDALPFIAIALSSQDRFTSFMALLALVFSYTVSYARARAEGLGYSMKVGLFERPERWIVLLVGIAFDMLFFAVSLLAFGSLFTTLQRAYNLKKLSGG
ncbi:MAG: CDP-alcohol phosphatidyltransferase family protein [Aquificota bacterium]|nr:MAG: CDP-alcohol phosphatidyltransferase family protein [Aquificota bacterium]